MNTVLILSVLTPILILFLGTFFLFRKYYVSGVLQLIVFIYYIYLYYSEKNDPTGFWWFGPIINILPPIIFLMLLSIFIGGTIDHSNKQKILQKKVAK